MVAELQLGFQSDVLESGVFRHYDTDIQSQIGILGAYVYSMTDATHPVGRNFKISSYDLTTGLISFDEYTPAQISELFDEFAVFTENLIQKLTTKIESVLAVNEVNPLDSLDLVYAITWNSVE